MKAALSCGVRVLVLATAGVALAVWWILVAAWVWRHFNGD